MKRTLWVKVLSPKILNISGRQRGDTFSFAPKQDVNKAKNLFCIDWDLAVRRIRPDQIFHV